MNKEQALNIYEYINSLYPTPKTELLYENEYELFIAVILSAQATDKSVNLATRNLFIKYDSFYKLSKANVLDVEKMIRSINYYKNKSSNIIKSSKIIIENYNGNVPNNIDDLTSLPGVGRKTANVILSTIYKMPAIAVDTHVLRVANRLSFIKSENVLDVEKALMKYYDKKYWIKVHHLFVLFGRYRCKSQKPLCSDCGLQEKCYYYKNKKE